jgi:hypothetical protein
VVQVQVLPVKNLVAILAGVLVPLVNVVTRELHLLARDAVEKEQYDHLRHPNFQGDGADHLLGGLALGEVPPAREVVGQKVPTFRVHYLSLPSAKKDKGSPGRTNINSQPQTIED